MSAPFIIFPLYLASLGVFSLSLLGGPLLASALGSCLSLVSAFLANRTRQERGWPGDHKGELAQRPIELSTLGPAGAALAGVVVAALCQFQGLAWQWQVLVADAVLIAGVVGISTLIDWSYVTPRLAGNGSLENLPCQSSASEEWRLVTRIWLLQRILAYAAVRVGLTASVALLLLAVFDKELAKSSTALGAVCVALFVFFSNRLMPGFKIASNPPFQVGDKVTLAEEYSTGVTSRPSYYVVDVAFEGFKLLELAGASSTLGRAAGQVRSSVMTASERDAPLSMFIDRKHDRTVALEDVARLLRQRDAYQGCERHCAGVNPRCLLSRGDPVNIRRDTGSK